MSDPLYRDASRSPKARAADLLARMTPAEKTAQLGSCWSFELLSGFTFSSEKAEARLANGIGQVTRLGGATNLKPDRCAALANQIQRHLREHTRLGVPAIVHEEICSGLMSWGATLFPQAIGVAAGWNPELVERMAAAIRGQMRAIGAHQGLAPLLDVCRDPRWGRTEETFGEDPYLVSLLGCAYVRGIQGGDAPDGVVATAKHFVGYGGAEGGMNWAPAKIPPRELAEVYLAPFEAAVRMARLGSVMNSYGEIDGVPCGASRWLMSQLLRDEWGFDGIVVSDYWAIPMLERYHHVARSGAEAAGFALRAGIDVDLPSTSSYGESLTQALDAGLVGMADVDRAALRVLTAKFRLGIFERPFVPEGRVLELFDTPAQNECAARLARQSIVLLSNNGILPLSPDTRSIALIGPSADDWRNLIGDYAYPCHVEVLAATKEDNPFGMPIPDDLGDVSRSLRIPTVLEALREVSDGGVRITHARGCDVKTEREDGIPEAVRLARESQVAILVLGDRAGLTTECTSGESRDCADLRLPGVQERLLEAILQTGTPVIVVLAVGRPYALDAFSDRVAALLCAWLPGQAGGGAVADALVGRFSPSGKLPISFPRSAGQVPVYNYHTPSGGRSHWTGDYVDRPASPLYPFGHGLSYATFAYKDLCVSPGEVTGRGTARVSFSIRNMGTRAAAEIAQLYVGYRPEGTPVTRPVRQLKGFHRVVLEPGQEVNVEIELATDELAFPDLDMKLRLYPGSVDVLVGSSSEDIRLKGSLRIQGPSTDIDPRTRRLFAESREVARG